MKRVILSILALALFVCSAKAQLLYRVSGNGLAKPSYILGTFHVAPAAMVDLIPGVREALDEVEQVCGEIDLLAATTPEYDQLIYELNILPFSLHIDDVLSEDQLRRLNAYMLKEFGYDLTNEYIYKTFCTLRPSALESNFANIIFAEVVPGYVEGESMDAYLQQEALRLGKGYTFLESIEFQMEMLYGPMSIDKEIEGLFSLVNHPEEYEASVRNLVGAYYTLDLKLVTQALEAIDGAEEAFDEIMVVNRNKNWIELMPKIMAERSTLFVVGTAHLPKECGIIKLLRKEGYKVKAVRK